jgi:membrane protein implicated in regulation of membrane protease activity
MGPSVKYTLGRLGIFVVVFAATLPIPVIDSLLVKAMVALLVSSILSLFLLRQWRDEMANQLSGAAQRRREQREKLRAALAGDDPGQGRADATGPAAAARAAGRAATAAADATGQKVSRDHDEKA